MAHLIRCRSLSPVGDSGAIPPETHR